MDNQQLSTTMSSMSEKPSKSFRDYLTIGAVVLRASQLVTSLFVFLSTVSLYLYIRHTRHFDAPLWHIQQSVRLVHKYLGSPVPTILRYTC